MGRGVAAYIPAFGAVESHIDAEIERMFDRIARPVLTDVSVDWGFCLIRDLTQ